MPGLLEAENPTTYSAIGAAMEVHNTLGPGFLEVTYQRALAIELKARAIPFCREEWIPIHYKGLKIDKRRVDFVVGDVFVEIKAKCTLEDRDFIQTLSYLKASGFQVALLINFGGKKLEFRRLLNHE